MDTRLRGERFALTFDHGPGARNTPRLLDATHSALSSLMVRAVPSRPARAQLSPPSAEHLSEATGTQQVGEH